LGVVVRRVLAIALCILLSGLPAIAADQTAGHITALIPAATRNSQPAQARDTIDWNDLLQTTQTGRLRAGLNDGSILSLGSNAQLRVVEHDAASQQTSLELDYGKLRNRVVKITQPNGKYEVKTPNAVIGVIGTDFYVAYENGRTTVICYAGQVSVTSLGAAKTLSKSSNANSSGQQTVLGPHQMVIIGNEIPPGGFPSESSMIQASMAETNIVAASSVAIAVAHPILIHAILYGVVAGVVGTAAGVAASQTITYHSNGIPPPVVCGANPRAKCGP
jgi:hypothetical protein